MTAAFSNELALGPNSAQNFKILASYPSNVNYKGTPLVKSIFNNYVSNAGSDELTIRQDFKDLYLISVDQLVYYPNNLTPVTLDSRVESASTLQTKHQIILSQARAILSWVNALKCNVNLTAAGVSILQQPVPISYEYPSGSEFFADLNNLPGQDGSGSSSDGLMVEDWFTQPMSFGFNTAALNDAQNHDSGIPDESLFAKFSRASLNTSLTSPGDVKIQYGVSCYDSVIPSFSFSSSKNLTIHILPIKATNTIDLNLAKTVAWDAGIVALPVNSSAGIPITYLSLTPANCNITSSTLLLLRSGSCRIQAAQSGDSDISPAMSVTQDIQIVPTISLNCAKGSKTTAVKGLQPKCPSGYKLKSQKIVQPRPIAFVAPQNPSNSNQQQSAPQQVAWNPPTGYSNLNNGFAYRYTQVAHCVANPSTQGKGPYSCGGISIYSNAACARITILSTFSEGTVVKDRPITYVSNFEAGSLVNVELDTTPGIQLSDKGKVTVDSMSCS